MSIERPTPKQPLPPEAKLVFKGNIFDTYQWEQKLYDDTTATFERLKRADTTVIIPVTADGRIILIDEEQPGTSAMITFPGGRMEEGEDPMPAARRELEEETGYTSPQELALWYALQPMNKIDWAVYVFIARGCVPSGPQKLDAGEKISLRLLSFSDAVDTVIERYPFSEEVVLRFTRAKYEPAAMAEMKKLFGVS